MTCKTFFDWSAWVYGLIGAVVAIAGYFGWTIRQKSQAKTTNTVIDGSRNKQSGGERETVNRVERGDDNVQKG